MASNADLPALETAIPVKTQKRYRLCYNTFTKWQKKNQITTFDEDVLLNYFTEAANTYKYTTLMSMYSMLRGTLYPYHNVDISKNKRLLTFLKGKQAGCEKVKSKIFTVDEINKFLVEAPDEHYLAMKVVLVFGVTGACRGEEITTVKIHHVTDHGTEIIVNLPKSNIHRAKVFVISGEFVKFVQKYIALRPANVGTDRFFLQYYHGECQCQVISKLQAAVVPKDIAKYLKLAEYKSYSGHSFRPSVLISKRSYRRKVSAIHESRASSKRLAVSVNGKASVESLKDKLPKENTVIEPRTSTRLAASTNTKRNNHNNTSLRQKTATEAAPSQKATYSSYRRTELRPEPISPMLPLTTALMKRKSRFYMGIQPDQFQRLLQLTSQRNVMSDVKLMLTLRKIRLNEDFEVLGDLFDLDRSTTEQYYHESKHTAIDLVDQLLSSNSTSSQFEIVTEPTIKLEVEDEAYASDPIALEPIASLYYEPMVTTESYESTTDEPIKTVKCESAVEWNGSEHVGIDTVKCETTTEMNVDDPDGDLEPKDDDHDDFEFNLPESSTEDRYFLSDELKKRTAECALCHKFYPPRLLTSHMDNVHNLNVRNLNRTMCGLCWNEYETEALLKTHQKEVHGGGSYGCDVCGKLFSTKRYMGVHILTKHARIKTYLCDTCGEGFPVQSSLRAHVIRKHVQPGHDCHLCDMKFLTPIMLKDHICARHSNERPYKCEVKGCGKTFSWPSSFKSHRRVHAEDKYECTICWKQFSFKGNYQNHMKTIHDQIVNNKCLSNKYI